MKAPALKKWVAATAVGLLLVFSTGATAQAEIIDPELEAILRCAAPTEAVDVIVGYSEQIDVRDPEIKLLVENLGATDIVVLWINNSIAATVPARAVSDLATLPGVVNIRPDAIVTLPQLPTDSGGFAPVGKRGWTETAVRRVFHTFAYGGFATDEQIKTWSCMDPGDAVREMLTFDAVNDKLSPAQDVTSDFGDSLKELQALWSSADPGNLTCPGTRDDFDETRVRADGNLVLRNQGLQNTWIQAVNKRGLNPFRHNVGFWLVNYQMAVNLHDTEPPLVRELYDSALNALVQGAPFHEVLALGASSAAVAREYGHRSNIYNNNTGLFRGNDDFAREFHQLFFRINGDVEDPDYHENTTIEHTAWALTGMQIDKEPNAYGTTLPNKWWVAPIDFSDHVDATGRTIRNYRRHYRGPLEILHETISGNTAEEKLYDLASVAINHPESLNNLPVAIINHFADDNLTDEKIGSIRTAWRAVVGQPNDLLRFLQDYAISGIFHRSDTFKYRTAFERNMTVYNLNTVDNEEAYGNLYSPRAVMQRQGAEVFIPVHDVFGGQTSLNAANNPNLFKEAYNSSVDFPNRIARTVQACRDADDTRLGTWRKDWARVIPFDRTSGYRVDKVGEWLWERFVSDNGKYYGPLEQAQVTALLATGVDFGYLADSNNPDFAYSATELTSEPFQSIVAANEAALMELDSQVVATRREANRRVGMAINFIAMTPFMFASEGTLAVASPPVTVMDVVGMALADAEKAIMGAGLTVGAMMSQHSDTMPAGSVVSQAPAAGASVAPGSRVNLVVSVGPEDQRPQVTINAPSDSALFSAGDTINFSGTASDPEDGNLTASLSWSSSLDGAIGSGGKISTKLSVGTHRITASVTDSKGQVDSAAIALTVKLAADRLRCRRAVYRVARDSFTLAVRSTDRTGERLLTAVMDVEGDGVFERELGEIPIKQGSRNVYKRNYRPFVVPNLTSATVIRVTSDLGGVCSRSVEMD